MSRYRPRVTTTEQAKLNRPITQAPSISKPSSPRLPQAWGSAGIGNYRQLSRTLTQIGSRVQDDRIMSNILGTILDARYDSINDQRESDFQLQRQNAQHEYQTALTNARSGDFSYVPQIKAPQLPSNESPMQVLQMMNQALATADNEGAIDAIGKVYGDELERRMGLVNSYRDQANSLTGYGNEYQNMLEEIAQRSGRTINRETGEATVVDPRQPIKELAQFFAGPEGMAVKKSSSKKPSEKEDEGGSGIMGVLKATTKLVTPDFLEPDEDSKVGSFLRKVEDESSDAMWWTIDKLSRPLYAVNEAGSEFYSLDEDSKKNDLGDTVFGGGAGKNPFSSLDEFFSDPLDSTKKLAGGAWSGLKGKDKTTFSDIVAQNAAQDQVQDIRDNTKYQMGVGLAGDLVLDPLNYVGVGLVKKPLDVVRTSKQAAQDAERLRTLSGDVAAITSQPQVPFVELNADQVFDMLGGNAKRPTSYAERQKNFYDSQDNLQDILNRVDAYTGGVTDKTPDVEALGRALHERREQVVNEWGQSALAGSIRRDVEIAIGKGLEPEDSLADFDRTLTTYRVAEALQSQRYYDSQMDTLARSLGFDDTWAYKDQTKTIAEDTGAKDFEDLIAPGKRKNIQGERTLSRKVRSHKEAHAQDNMRTKRSELTDDDELARQIDDGISAADSPNLYNAIKELRLDPRFTEADVTQAYKDSIRLARDPRISAEYDNLAKTSASISNKKTGELAKLNGELARAEKAGNEKWTSTVSRKIMAAERRLKIVNRTKDRIQADILVRLLDQRLQGGKSYFDPEAAVGIQDELAELTTINRNSTDFTEDGVHVDERIAQLNRDLKNFEGLPEQPRTKLDKLPEGFTTDDFQFNPATGEFHITKKVEDSEVANWYAKVNELHQVEYEKAYNRIWANGTEKRKLNQEYREGGESLDKADWNKRRQTAEKASRNEAAQSARTKIANDIRHDNLSIPNFSSKLELNPIHAGSSEDDLLEALKWKLGDEEAQLIAAKKVATTNHNAQAIKDIDVQLSQLKHKRTIEIARFEKAQKQVKETKQVLRTRLQEEAILKVASAPVASQHSALSIHSLGNDWAIPGTAEMFALADKAGGLPVIRKARQVFADAFKSPNSRIPEELQLLRSRALGRTPDIIERHLNKLKGTLGQFDETTRTRAMRDYAGGARGPRGTDPAQDALEDAFTDLLPYMQGKFPVGQEGEVLSVADINKYLDDAYQLDMRAVERGINTPQQLINAVRSNKGKAKGYADLKDPYRISWNLRIAIELAAGRKAMDTTIANTFGVKRLYTVGNDGRAIKRQPTIAGDSIEKLRDLGWETIPRLGNGHYYPKESVKDISRLLDMMEPRNITTFGRLADDATGIWKTATTLYNPGYYTRNGVGEIMSSWLGGVNTVRPYRDAMSVIKYARRDGAELEALKHQFALQQYVKSDIESPTKQIGKMRNGFNLTNENVWIAYNDQGLRTGFFNTEAGDTFNKLGDKARGNALTRTAANTHTKIRNGGEWYEDWLRMSHFVDVIKKSKASTLEKAAQEAAQQVRKYHFDYTDFTPFEKTYMLRAFPFYKWTRKAAPLMLTMMFTKPGKVMAYSKIMNGISNSVNTQDIAGGDNGYAPNYEGIVPSWIQDMWAYQIADSSSDDDDFSKGRGTYFNLATPQMDSYKSLTNPGGTAYTLLNPLVKIPAEQIAGRTLGQLFDENAMEMDLDSKDDRLNHLLRSTPQGNYAQKEGVVDGGDASLWDRLSFLTGGGFYENNEKRQLGELINRSK